MSRLKLPLLLGSIFIILCSGLALFPLYFYQQIPHFARYPDTKILDQKLYGAFDNISCQLTLFHKQTLESTQTGDVFWERLPESWQAPNHEFLGYHDLARHRIRLQKAATINNQISILRNASRNQIFTSNSATAHFPASICRIIPLSSGFINP